jgi:hypothetical protein
MSIETFQDFVDEADLNGAIAAISQLQPGTIRLEMPLYYAAKLGKHTFVNLFLEYAGMTLILIDPRFHGSHIDPFVYQETGKDVGLTPIHIATTSNHLEVVKTLLLYGLFSTLDSLSSFSFV